MTRQFEIDIAAFVKKTEKKLDSFMLEFTQDLAEEVIKATPVDTGFLRGSWFANIGSPDVNYLGSFKGPEGGKEAINGQPAMMQAINTITLKLKDVKAGHVIYYTNNVQYGPNVEFGSYRSSGFVRRTVARAKSIAEEALRKVVKNV